MSAPSSGSGSPSAGFYPDPSIPGYIRYWNGSAWVPGTSRPEPRDGDPVPSPPVDKTATEPVSVASEPAPTEETGPVFLDEEAAEAADEATDQAANEAADGAEGKTAAGERPESASAWQADAARQGGLGGQSEGRVSWGSDEGRTPDPRGDWGRAADERPRESTPAADPAKRPAPRDGTFQMRTVQGGEGEGGGAPVPEHTVGLRRSEVLKHGGQQTSPAQSTPPQRPPAQQSPAQHQHQQHQQQSPPQQQPSWTQQVHDLAARPAPPSAQQSGQDVSGLPAQPQSGGPDAVMPWRPPTSDPFLQAAQRQARPAELGKRFAARLVDGVITSAVVGAVAFPFLGKAADHVQQKIDAVKAAGETKQVWLIDGTTSGYLGIVLGVLLVFGLLYEVLPTSRWGRTLGKKLLGLRVLDVEGQEKPAFGAALTRWLVYGALSLLVIGVVNVLWCVFDRPWRQCWHDKAARTFVSKDSGEIRL